MKKQKLFVKRQMGKNEKQNLSKKIPWKNKLSEKKTFRKKCLEKETTPLETKTTPLKKENKFLFEKKKKHL